MDNKKGTLGILSILMFWGGIAMAVISLLIGDEYDAYTEEYTTIDKKMKGIILFWGIALIFYIIDKIRHNKENQILKIPVEEYLSTVQDELKRNEILDIKKITSYLNLEGIMLSKSTIDDLKENLSSIEYPFPLNLAEFLARKKLYKEAIRITTRCIENNSSDKTLCLLLRVKIYLRMGEYYESKNDSETLVQTNPTHDEAYLYRALSNYGLGRIDAAYADYNLACKYGDYPEGGLSCIFSAFLPMGQLYDN